MEAGPDPLPGPQYQMDSRTLRYYIDYCIYVIMVGLLAYYLYLLNQPKTITCVVVNEKKQVCEMVNFLGVLKYGHDP